ncbi:hypothetical protein ACN47E_010034 [Coniothyrium glycines]
MEFILRCNDLKCRAQLGENAVVTTCSHVFCTRCAESTGLSSSASACRLCPACGATLHNPDDVVMAGLNPSEDYKTSVLSGLSPTIIMECASRGLAFHSYQTSQEIVYQEHLAKALADKYETLSQQMDQLIHEANSQIKGLQEKLQVMQAEQAVLEEKNHSLASINREKAKAQARTQQLYQTLKARVMASQVADAAGNEVQQGLPVSRRDHHINRLPGTRIGSAANYIPSAADQQTNVGKSHYRDTSRSSSNGQQHGGISIGPPFPAHLRARMHTGQTNASGTPSQPRHSRLPVLGGARQNDFLQSAGAAPSYQASPATRQPLGSGINAANPGTFALNGKVSRRGGTGAVVSGRQGQ